MKAGERIPFLDLARGFAIVTMVLQHAMIIYEKGAGEDTLSGLGILFLGTAPAAPVFLFLMGLFFARSKKTSLRRELSRGLQLLLLGYALNLVRFTLPVLIRQQSPLYFEAADDPFSLLLVVDILQMAGLSLIILSLLKRFCPWPALWLVLALGVAMDTDWLGRPDFGI